MYATLAATDAKKPKLKKAVKFGMIKTSGSIEDKFKLIKSLGFEGVEFDSPSNVDAAAALGIHGIHFRSPPALRDELTALGLLS